MKRCEYVKNGKYSNSITYLFKDGFTLYGQGVMMFAINISPELLKEEYVLPKFDEDYDRNDRVFFKR